MKWYLILLVSSVILSACQTDPKQDRSENPKSSTDLSPDIQGHWQYVSERTMYEPPKFVNITQGGEYVAKEWLEFQGERRTDYIFTKDSFFRFSFPMELYDRGTYRIDTQYLFLEGEMPYAPMPVQIHDDTLMIYLEEDNLYLKEMFTKSEFDHNLVALLKKDRINYAELSRSWHLVDGHSGGDGTGVDYLYPFHVPDSLVIGDELLTADNLKDSIVELNIGGKLRPFYCQFWYDDHSIQHMRLEPTPSWDKSEARMWFLPWPNYWSPEDYPTAEDIRKLKTGEGGNLFLEFSDHF